MNELPRRRPIIGPSILTADLLHLGDQIRLAEDAGVDFFHLDVMDGHFVPNITFGLPIVAAIRDATDLPLDVHLMIETPEHLIDEFIVAGADFVTIHVEACTHLHAALMRIRERGAVPGVTLNPATPLVALEEAVKIVGQVLIMTVNPGFGGQSFIPGAIDRIERTRALIDATNPMCKLEVDGGVKVSNIGRLVAAGADMLVAGSAVFNPDRSVAESVAELRSAADLAAIGVP